MTPIHILLFSFSILSLVNVFLMPVNIIYQDELWHWLQAKAIADGELILFGSTNPYLFPFLLSLVIKGPVLGIRFLPLAFMAAATAVYFSMIKRYFGNFVAVLSTLIFLLHFRILLIAPLILSESLFFLLLFISLSFLFTILNNNRTWKNFILLGLALGLTIETRAVVPLIPLFFIYYLFRDGPKQKIKISATLAISIAIYLPYQYFYGSGNITKRLLPLQNLEVYAHRINDCISYNGSFFSFLFIAALIYWFSRRKLGTIQNTILKICASFTICYLACVIFFVNEVYLKYYVIIIPFCSLLIGNWFSFVNDRSKKIGLLIWFFLIASITKNIDYLPSQGNFFFINLPAVECQVIKHGIKFTEKSIQHVRIPYFGQKINEEAQYVFEFASIQDFQYLTIGFLPDPCKIYLDNNFLGYHANPFGFFTYKFKDKLPQGKHTITIIMKNLVWQGGLGQIILSNHTIYHYCNNRHLRNADGPQK